MRNKPAGEMNNQKGESHVVDNCGGIDSSVAAGADNQLHDGRVYSYPDSRCHYRLDNRFHSGAKARLKRGYLC